MKYLMPLAVLFMFTGCQTTPNEWSLASPSGKLMVNISMDEQQQLQYEVKSAKASAEAVTLIDPSPLGIVREDVSFTSGLAFKEESDVVAFTEAYTLTSGKQSGYENSGNELQLTFSAAEGDLVQLIFRVFDNGVAFRYHFPEENPDPHVIIGEQSGFMLPEGSKAWIQPYDEISKYTPAYEKSYENGIKPGTEAKFNNGWGFPALFQLESNWILLTETDINRSHFGSHLHNETGSNLYTIRLPEEDEALQTGNNKATSPLPWKSPWRVIYIGETLGDIVESSLVTDLSQPAAFEDTSWIKPGISSWSWWSDASSSRDFDKLKNFIDLAADMGWEYSLIDANWNIMEGGNIETLIDYATQKGVGVLMWYNSGGPHNTVTEQPRDIMANPGLRKAEFKKLQEWGVKGIKVDFFQSDQQHIISQYIDIMEDAAAHQIMTNFHGCTIPRGWRRTYPNFMTMESVRGGECYQFDSSFPATAPEQNTILPFTRNVIGPMDYTPVTFSNNNHPHITSNPHEAALGIIFESGLQHLADAVEPYRNVHPKVQEYLRSLPASWDETKLVSGFPGKDVVMARRKGEVWYIGGINGENLEKTFTLTSLEFLDGKNYNVQLIKDAAVSHDFAFEDTRMDNDGSISIKTIPYGGFVAVLQPE